MATFSTYAYTANSGDTFRIRLADDSAVAGGFTATTGFDPRLGYVRVSKRDREFGIRPRGVRLSRNVGEEVRSRFLATATTERQQALLAAGTVQIGQNDWTVNSQVAEDI